MTRPRRLPVCARVFSATLSVALSVMLSACMGLQTLSSNRYTVKDLVLVHSAANDTDAAISKNVMFNPAADSGVQLTRVDEAINFLGAPESRNKIVNGERLHFDRGGDWCAVAWFFVPIPLVLPVRKESVSLEFIDGVATEAVITNVMSNYEYVQHP